MEQAVLFKWYGIYRDLPCVDPRQRQMCISGRFFIGAGIGLAIRGGAVLDRTQIAAPLLSKSSALL